MTYHLIKGYFGERLAELYLRLYGLKTIARNYRCPYGEIDLIMLEQNTCVFVEVKSRTNNAHHHEYHHVGICKQQKILKTSHVFLLKHPDLDHYAIRYDVFIIQLSDLSVTWLNDAFSPP